MNKIQILILIPLLALSCKNNDELLPNPDQIIYFDLDPDVVMNSIDYLFEHPRGCGLVPSFADSVIEYSLDADLDANNDFKITVQTTNEFVSASNPCTNNQYRMFIEKINSSAIVYYQPDHFNNENFIEAGSFINSSLAYGTSAMFHLVAPLTPHFDFD